MKFYKSLSMMGQPLYSADGGQGGAGSNDNSQGAGQNQDPNNGQGSNNNAGQQGNDDSQNKQNEHMIPKSRFDEVNNTLKTLQAELDKFKNEQSQAELDAKKKKGEFEDLYNTANTELEQFKSKDAKASERIGQLEGIIQTLVDAELASVPEEMRDLVPENFTAEQKLSWITSAKQKGLFGTTQNSKEDKELGGATNNQSQSQQIDIGKMSVAEMLRSAYGNKK